MTATSARTTRRSGSPRSRSTSGLWWLVVDNTAPVVVPLFNLPPAVGEPARFGFYFDQSPVYLDTSVRTGEGYGVRVSVDNITQQVVFVSSRVTFWGVPGEADATTTRAAGAASTTKRSSKN